MAPLEPGLSFIAERYLNHVDNHLSRFIHHFRRHEELHHSARTYYSCLTNCLDAFQKEVPAEQRSVLFLSEPEADVLKMLSVYRQTGTGNGNQLVSLQFERFPQPIHSQSSDLGPPKMLRKALEENPGLSLTCLLNPVRDLMDTLTKMDWKTTIDANTGSQVITCMTDGKVAVFIDVAIAEFEADTAAIKEYHANKEHKDA
jgi:hypothetical protein